MALSVYRAEVTPALVLQGTKETKRFPGAEGVPAVDRTTAEWQAPDLKKASKTALT